MLCSQAHRLELKHMQKILPSLVCLTAFFALQPGIAMGYDLHITKSSDWTNSAKDPIREDQWKALVDSDDELKMDTSVSAQNPSTGEVIELRNPLMASWIDSKTGDKHYFYFRSGEITVKNPTENAIKKMKEVALKIGAKVQGDEGEFY